MFLIVPLQFTLTPNLKIKSDTGVLDSDKAVCLNVYFVGQITDCEKMARLTLVQIIKVLRLKIIIKLRETFLYNVSR